MLTDRQKENVYDWFTSKMTSMFAPPYHIRSDSEAVKEALSQYVEQLGAYGPVILDVAWKAIARVHTKPSWPPLAECIAACEKAKSDEWAAKKEPVLNPYEAKPYDPPDPILTHAQLAKLKRELSELKHSKSLCAAPLRRWGNGILARHERAISERAG